MKCIWCGGRHEDFACQDPSWWGKPQTTENPPPPKAAPVGMRGEVSKTGRGFARWRGWRRLEDV